MGETWTEQGRRPLLSRNLEKVIGLYREDHPFPEGPRLRLIHLTQEEPPIECEGYGIVLDGDQGVRVDGERRVIAILAGPIRSVDQVKRRPLAWGIE